MPAGQWGLVPDFMRGKKRHREDCYSEDEIRERLLQMDDATYRRLLAFARRQALWANVQPSDIVHEAVERLLKPDGRSWPKRFTLEQILFGANGILRSICSELRHKEASRRELEETFASFVECQDDVVLDFLDKEDLIAEIVRTLEDDPLAQMVIGHLVAGKTREEIQNILSITYDEYQNTRRRILRHLEQRARV